MTDDSRLERRLNCSKNCPGCNWKLFHYFPPIRIFSRLFDVRNSVFVASLTRSFSKHALIGGPLVINRFLLRRIPNRASVFIRERRPKAAPEKKPALPTMDLAVC